MPLKPFALFFCALIALAPPSYARRAAAYRHSNHPSHHNASGAFRSTHQSRRAVGVPRDSHGRIKRSYAAKHEFMKETGYPHGRPGHVVDHIVPLKKGGADDPSNMQWQTTEEAKDKDRWE